MMKLNQIIDAAPSFFKLSGCDMHIQIAYRIKKLGAVLQNHCDIFDKKRYELLKKYGQQDELGQFVISAENLNEFQQALDELLNSEVDITFDKVKIPLSENFRLSSNDVGFLMPFIEFVETE